MFVRFKYFCFILAFNCLVVPIALRYWACEIFQNTSNIMEKVTKRASQYTPHILEKLNKR